MSEIEIAARKAQLLQAIDLARRDIDAAELELSDIAAVERQMKRVAAQPPLPLVQRPPPDPPPPTPVEVPRNRFEGLSQAILSILKNQEKIWWTANEIQKAASEMKGKQVPMSSISPKLTELKNKDVIRRDEMVVALTARVDPAHDL